MKMPFRPPGSKEPVARGVASNIGVTTTTQPAVKTQSQSHTLSPPISTSSMIERHTCDSNVKVQHEQFHKCYWSKDIKKKHKVLEEGVIIFQGNKVQLYNSDGLKIYDSYSSKLFCPNPDNADQFIVGCFFVEQDGEIKKDDFMSRRCFVKQEMPMIDNSIDKKKQLSAPLKLNNSSEPQKAQEVQVPQTSFLLTDSYEDAKIFPVYLDPFLNENMRIHQKQGVKFMLECISGLRGPNISGCILADSMGLGKTLQTIALIWTVIRKSPYSSTEPLIKKVVIVAPVSLLGTWKKEVKKWLGEARLIPKIAIGSREDVLLTCTEFAMSPQKLLLISYEQFRMHIEELASCCDLLIFDEGHRLKNMNIKTFRSFNSIKCSKRIILTGTPLQNSLMEFYSCVKFVNPNIFESEKQFKNNFSEPILAALKSDATPQIIEKAAVRSKELTQVISKFVLRRKADILEKLLPPRSEYFIFLKLTDFQEYVYQKMIEAHTEKSEFESDTGTFGLLTVMRKLLNHPQLIYTDQGNQSSYEFKQYFPLDFELDDWNKSFKFKFVSDILNSMKTIEQQNSSIERVIIVSYWTQTLDIVETMIKEKNLNFVRLDGSVNAQKRQEIIDRFQDPLTHLRVFLLCGKAGGTGLNLTAANRMILMEPDWNPSNDLQVMGRIWRDGQTKPVHIYRLISCGTMEEKVLQRQFLKEDLSQNVVDDKMIVKAHNNELMKQLFEYRDDNKCLTFKEEENELLKLKIHTPDYVEGMEDYINFVKHSIKGEKGHDEIGEKLDKQEKPSNEFDEGNIFLKPESSTEEEDDDNDSSEGEQDEEKLVNLVEKVDQGDQQLENYSEKEFITEIIEQNYNQNTTNVKAIVDEITQCSIVPNSADNNPNLPLKKARKREYSLPENPCLQILKKLKK